MSDAQQGVIRRKLAEAARAVAAIQGGAERALPLALARATQDLFAQVVSCADVRAFRVSLTELPEHLPERALIALLDGPAEATGIVVLSPDMLAALIEMQTLGRVSAQPPPPRRPTRTDAAMVEDWIDAVLAGLEGDLLQDEDLTWADGFRYASHLVEPRALGVVLEDTAYRLLRLQIRFEGGREGQILLALPAAGQGRRPASVAVMADDARPEAAPVMGSAPDAETQIHLQEAEAVVQAVLTRITLPLSAVLQLKPGDLLPLTQAALDRIEITGLDGRPCAIGRLGQSRGQRALRLLQCGLSEGDLAPLAAHSKPSAPPPSLRLAATG